MHTFQSKYLLSVHITIQAFTKLFLHYWCTTSLGKAWILKPLVVSPGKKQASGIWNFLIRYLFLIKNLFSPWCWYSLHKHHTQAKAKSFDSICEIDSQKHTHTICTGTQKVDGAGLLQHRQREPLSKLPEIDIKMEIYACRSLAGKTTVLKGCFVPNSAKFGKSWSSVGNSRFLNALVIHFPQD